MKGKEEAQMTLWSFLNIFGRLGRLEAWVAKIPQLEAELMDMKVKFVETLQAIDAATTAIAEDLAELKAKIEGAGMTAADEAEVLAKLTEAADKLKAMAADPEVPVPPPQ